ncbi:hypothetical protein JTB14_034857 [Gonioctena quinquepunctata]|nr:hypothetical protein JTB14_034857 [Gonioctena quinquepunctata]
MHLRNLAVIFFIFCIPTDQGATVSSNSIKQDGKNVTGGNVSSPVPLFHYGNKSYYMGIYMKLNFMQAKQFCDNIGMELLSIESEAENSRIYTEIREMNKGDEYWSSGSRLVDGKNWMWMTTGHGLEYSKWATGQPDSPVDQCLLLAHQKNVGLFWNDRDCNLQTWFICEKKFDGKLSTSRVTNPSFLDHNSPLWPNIKLMHFRNKVYYFARQFKGTFLQGIEFCQMINMRLVTISSEEENSRIHKYIRDTMAGDNWWTSGTRILDGERWVWMSNGEQVEYTNWLAGQPDNINDLCLHLIEQRNIGLFWNDANCNTVYGVICEAPNENYIDERRFRKNIDYWNGGDWELSAQTDVRDEGDERVFTNSGKNVIRGVPPGSIHLSYHEGKTYHIEIEKKVTFIQATKLCGNHNMQLVVIDKQGKIDALKRLLIDSGEINLSGLEFAMNP